MDGSTSIVRVTACDVFAGDVVPAPVAAILVANAAALCQDGQTNPAS